MNFPTLICFLASILAAPAWSATMGSAQAEAYFSSAKLSARGHLGESDAVAVLIPTKAGAKLEIWRQDGDRFELLANAPKAGCLDCSGPTHKSNPTRIWFSDDSIHVEYQGGGAGLGFWAWRSSWAADPALGGLRAVATQRIGSDKSGEARHAMVSFIDGDRTERLRADHGFKASTCRAAISKLPNFSDLSLPGLFNGTLEPECLLGTETGDSLAETPALDSASLDDLMRSSRPR